MNYSKSPAQAFCRKKLPTCPEGQFMGPSSGTCRLICPDGQYLVSGSGSPGACKPKPPGKLPDDADPDMGKPDTCSGNPINTATGNKYQQEVDSPAGTGVPLVRSYNSSDRASWPGLGTGWRHNWNARVVPVYATATQLLPPKPADVDPDFPEWPTFSTDPKLTLVYYRIDRSDGASVSTDANGVLIDPSNALRLSVSKLADGFLVSDGRSTERYDASGNLISLQQAGGRRYTLSYNGSRLSTVTDIDSGRSLQFSYDSTGNRLVRVDSGSQLLASFGYDANGLLSQVTHADATTRQYVYDDANAPGKLSGIIDEASNRYATWAYDATGRAVSSEHAGGVERYSLTFGTDGSGLSSWTDETGPLGATRRFSFQLLGKRSLYTGTNQPATSGCQAGISQFGYDTDGNLTSQQDLVGNTTTYTYDPARKLETSRTEAAGTTLARTISTDWHPTFALPTRITEPGRRTDLSYDAAGNLLTQTITDLGNQQSRTWTYSYDSANRLLSSKTPANLSTSYTYDAQGNLATVTDAAGLVTRYTQYDANGLPLTLVRPAGAYSSVTIKLQYDAMGRLTQRTEGNDVTVYAYTSTGLLRDVSLPDGKQLHYDYDAARRLTAVTDSLGNRIAYTLDAMGNRTHEAISDSSASLQAMVARIDTDRSPLLSPTTQKAR
ncbi:RHS repeat domain-containing protein [Chitinimonas naiadis]